MQLYIYIYMGVQLCSRFHPKSQLDLPLYLKFSQLVFAKIPVFLLLLLLFIF